MPTLIDRAGIAGLIPHAGDMCLLDAVLAWDRERIACATGTHRAPHNPLRHAGRIGILCGIEYAAQAMALHGALGREDGGTPERGYLASVRGLRCHADRLDDLPGMLEVTAERMLGDGGRVIYAFALRHDGRVLLAGRAAVVIGGALP